jgi:biotin transport system substrate-specific component
MPTSAVPASRFASFSEASATLPGRILIGLSATAIVAVAAHVSIPLPFTPVPLTLQPLAVLGVGLALGPLDGFLAMLAYLAEGVMGMPVFSPVGPGGLVQMLGPSGGFLMAYPMVAAIAGSVTRLAATRVARSTASSSVTSAATSFTSAAIGCTLATMLLFFCGAAWFMQYAHHSLQATWIGAVAPFLPGEAVKIVIAAGVYSTLCRSTLRDKQSI